tara:strand:- start:267 stop:440 length:174 start_codon:yes stop_codon:yes gene_type:complete
MLQCILQPDAFSQSGSAQEPWRDTNPWPGQEREEKSDPEEHDKRKTRAYHRYVLIPA